MVYPYTKQLQLLGMMFVLLFSALNVIVYYAVSIFQISSVAIDPNLASVIVGITLLVSCGLTLKSKTQQHFSLLHYPIFSTHLISFPSDSLDLLEDIAF